MEVGNDTIFAFVAVEILSLLDMYSEPDTMEKLSDNRQIKIVSITK